MTGVENSYLSAGEAISANLLTGEATGAHITGAHITGALRQGVQNKTKDTGIKHTKNDPLANNIIANELHTPIIRNFPNKKTFQRRVTMGADLAEMLSRCNKGIIFKLNGADIYKKYAFVVF